MYNFSGNFNCPSYGSSACGSIFISSWVKNCISGRRKSSSKSNLLWSIVRGKTREEGPPHFAWSCYECANGISVSRCPCRKNAGHFTFGIRSMFLNLSFTRYWSSLPACSLTISLIDKNGLIMISAHGLRYDAMIEAGPVPIERPKRIILLSLIPRTIVR